MNPVAKALSFIETLFAGEITLTEISNVAGVSVATWCGHLAQRPVTRSCATFAAGPKARRGPCHEAPATPLFLNRIARRSR